ncbi:MAG: SH3 domain-containing protein [Candidatus Rifleibacteriota bacterium]
MQRKTVSLSKRSFKNCRASLVSIVVIMAALLSLPLSGVQLNVARAGIVENVPLEAPYNGCLVVRQGPGFEHPVIGHVVNGDRVTIDSGEGSWYRITSPKTGYVWATYIKITDEQTVDTESMSQALSLEDITANADPWKREQNLQQRLQRENEASPLKIPGLENLEP